ncbi:7-deoxyloganetin glucosyltransferase-like [Zingiber officinale]|uniref:Glycosyltransferase n=1 Tax=Zingiber officinale TaxID=94328 RepID=A0A8J5GHP1_ZINOF|nr:7-deoxyloganetin glucosyltransferase-like [Zingiber officinale]KAG6507854.1 hypothetical protein ZIOFF_033207 [Zingiber officinale]
MPLPHAVLITYPTAGQLNPMLQLAQLLHSKGFYITFVNTEFGYRQLLRGNASLDALFGRFNRSSFRFVSIPDGICESDLQGPGYLLNVWFSIVRNCPAALHELLLELNSSPDVPRLTCIITNFLVTFPRDVADRLGVPELVFWTTSACGLMASLHVRELVRRGYVPLKDESCLTNGYLDTAIDWIPGMKDIRLRDISSFIRTTDRDDFYLKEEMEEADYALKSQGLILNTFEGMEGEVLDALRGFFPRIYALGAIGSLIDQISGSAGTTTPMRLGSWDEEEEEDRRCAEWLEAQQRGSVVYVSFGSITTLTRDELAEFAWGLAESGRPFLWVVRPGLVEGGIEALPGGLVEETKGRSLLVKWCHQGKVLSHPAIGVFLTHGGWNSMMESVARGVPMICWPGFADQYTNCRYACKHWGFGMEIEEEVRRGQVREVVREALEGEKGEEMRKKAMEWKEKARRAATEDGTSFTDLARLANDLNQLTTNTGIKQTKHTPS